MVETDTDTHYRQTTESRHPIVPGGKSARDKKKKKKKTKKKKKKKKKMKKSERPTHHVDFLFSQLDWPFPLYCWWSPRNLGDEKEIN